MNFYLFAPVFDSEHLWVLLLLILVVHIPMVLLGEALAPSTCPRVSGVAEELAYHILQHYMFGFQPVQIPPAPLDLGLGSGTKMFPLLQCIYRGAMSLRTCW